MMASMETQTLNSHDTPEALQAQPSYVPVTDKFRLAQVDIVTETIEAEKQLADSISKERSRIAELRKTASIALHNRYTGLVSEFKALGIPLPIPTRAPMATAIEAIEINRTPVLKAAAKKVKVMHCSVCNVLGHDLRHKLHAAQGKKKKKFTTEQLAKL